MWVLMHHRAIGWTHADGHADDGLEPREVRAATAAAMGRQWMVARVETGRWVWLGAGPREQDAGREMAQRWGGCGAVLPMVESAGTAVLGGAAAAGRAY